MTLGNGEILTLKGVALNAITSENVALDRYLSAGGATTTTLTATKAGQTLNGTDSNDNMLISTENVTLAGGKGDDVYVVGSAATQIIEKAGQGIDTVQAWTGEGYALPTDEDVENLTMMGNANSWAMGNQLANIITGTSGNNIIDGGKGDDILIGGGGQDVFVVHKSGGSDVIADFTASGAGIDQISLGGYDFHSFADVKAALHQIGTDTVLDLGAGETLTMRGVTAESLTAANFNLSIDTSGMVKTFADEFDISFSWFHNDSGTWQTSMVYGGDNAYFSNPSEQQVFVDPSFKGLTATQAKTSLGLNPYSIENGQLVITAAPIDPTIQQYMGSQQFTTGIMTTASSFAQTYGYFEISTTLPEEKGTWPAFWMLPVDNVAPVELDIFESLGDRTDGVHVQTHGSSSSEMDGTWVPVEDIGSQHTYGVLWTPYDITFYVDGVEVASYATPEDMNRPMYLIAGLGMGGAWGGDADPTITATMGIDYIHAFQLPDYTLAALLADGQRCRHEYDRRHGWYGQSRGYGRQ
ncbi:beta-glucanase (GH16 family) [Bradyrhizobium sp. LB9.1b]